MLSPADWGAALIEPGDPQKWTRFDSLPEDERRAIVLELKAVVDWRARNSPESALPAAEALVRAAEPIADLIPLALRGRAVASHFNGRPEAARPDFQRAAELYELAGEPLEAARVRRSLVDVDLLLGDSKSALEMAALARPVFVEHGEEKLLAQLENNVGNVYVRLDEYPAAREHYDRAIKTFESANDVVGTAIGRFNLGVVEQNANALDACEVAFAEARTAFEEAGFGTYVADCDYHLAYLESRRGHFREAIAGLEAAAVAYEENGKPTGIPLCHLDLAEIYLRLDARRDALEHADKASASFAELGLAYEQGKALTLAGLARLRLSDQVGASARLEQARALFVSLDNRVSAAALEIQLASLELSVGDTTVAIERLETARRELGKRELRMLADLATITLARAHMRAGDAPRAEALLRELNELRADDHKHPFDCLLLSDALRLLADARRDLGDRAGAIEILERAVEVIDETYAQVPGRDLRVAFFRDRHGPYVDLAWELAESDEPAKTSEALTVLERSRLRSVTAEAVRAAREPEELRAARDQLDWMLARELDREIGATVAAHELRGPGPSSTDVRGMQRELRRLARRAENKAVDAQQPLSFRPDDVESARRGDEILLVYLATERGLRVFVADGTELASLRLPTELAHVVGLRRRLALQVSKLRLGTDYSTRHAAALARTTDALFEELGQVLVQPVAEQLGERFAGRPLTIVPYGELHDLPFHAFRVNGRPLILDHEVSYALSTTLLARTRSEPELPRGPILATGVAENGLPAVTDELATLAARFGDDFERVPAEDLLNRLRDRPPVGGALHIATHGVFQPTAPLFSALLLGKTLITAHDLLRTPLPLRLVVLSGCETGRKRQIAGDELIGLSRALLESGVRATLASLWPVDDDVARRFMGAFYEALAGGANARTAVARAQRSQLESETHPFSWASFTLIGDPEVTVPSHNQLP